MSDKRLIVAIDGPAGVGKTTLAMRTAKALGLAYLDTGAMFRACALRLGDGAWDLPEAAITARLLELTFSLEGSGEETRLLVNGLPVGDEIRTETVGFLASRLATLPVVRAFQKAAQQTLGRDVSLVVEGRDMGTAVFPEAPFKFFLDARPEVRAKRRELQLQAMGKPADYAEILAQIKARDDQDRNRAASPLAPASDAIIIDTSDIDVDQVFERILSRIKPS